MDVNRLAYGAASFPGASILYQNIREDLNLNYTQLGIIVGVTSILGGILQMGCACATKLNNQQLSLTHFHSIRRRKATELYHRTKGLFYVQQFLGHKSISNTLKYIQQSNALFDEDKDSYICKIARTIQDATELVELCFDYVTVIDGARA